MNIYAAFSVSEIHQMLMPAWGMLSLPVPIHHNAEWRWISLKYEIDEQSEAEARQIPCFVAGAPGYLH